MRFVVVHQAARLADHGSVKVPELWVVYRVFDDDSRERVRSFDNENDADRTAAAGNR